MRISPRTLARTGAGSKAPMRRSAPSSGTSAAPLGAAVEPCELLTQARAPSRVRRRVAVGQRRIQHLVALLGEAGGQPELPVLRRAVVRDAVEDEEGFAHVAR